MLARSGFGGLDVDLAREQARQQQVAGAAEVSGLKNKGLHLSNDWPWLIRGLRSGGFTCFRGAGLVQNKCETGGSRPPVW